MTPTQAGIGWRSAHFDELLQTRPPLGFIEVHTERFVGTGQALLSLLGRGRDCYELSLHGNGLLLNSIDGIDQDHLRHVVALARRFEPWIISDHASMGAFSAGLGDHRTLDTLCNQVMQVQDQLQQAIAIENLMFDMRGQQPEISEALILAELTQRTGCKLLVDVNNIYVNAVNEFRREVRHRFDAPSAEQTLPVTALARGQAWLDMIPAAAVAELHVSGYQDFGSTVINDHGSAATDPVWSLYGYAIRRFGPVPTLIEWDNNIPPLCTLLDEALYADRLNQEALLACADAEPAGTGNGCLACMRA